MTKELKEKAINIKGKSYVQVADRVLYFNETYLKGCINTTLVSSPADKMVIVKAKVTPDIESPDRYFTGYSQATWGDGMVNKMAALENAETSAVGRALSMMGIGVIDSIASVDEMSKAGVPTVTTSTPTPTTTYKALANVETGPMCEEHGVPFIKYTKEGKSWHSHKNEDGTWHNLPKAPVVVQEDEDIPLPTDDDLPF